MEADGELFKNLREQYLLDEGKQKRGDNLVAGLWAGLVDSSCVRWTFCKAAWRKGEPDWPRLHWQPLSLEQPPAQQQQQGQQQGQQDAGKGGRKRQAKKK